MRLRPKITVLLLFLSIIPLVTVSFLAYYSAVTSLRENLGSYFRFIARRSAETIDAKVFEISQNVRQWASLELMQDVVTGDLDGRIVSFLTRLSKEEGIFSTVDVLNIAGEVVASSSASLMGKNLSQEKFFQKAAGGSPYIGDVELDPAAQEWGINFVSPLWAEYGRQKELIGILRAHWKARELSGALTISLGGDMPSSRRVLLIRKDGVVIAGTEGRKGILSPEDRIRGRFEAVSLARQRLEGYLVERSRADKKEYLIGYSFSKGYQDFAGLGWSVLVIQEGREVFTSVYRLAFLMFGIGILAVAAVIFISLKVSRKITAPILDIARAAGRVAGGNLSFNVEYPSGDELGALATAFNKMVGDLKGNQIQLLNEKTYTDSIISSMADALFVVDVGGLIRLVNKRAADLSGYAAQELKGQSLRKLFGEDIEEFIFKKEEGGRTIRVAERMLTARNGREVPVVFSSSVMFDPHQQIRGIVCLVQDITEYKKAQEQIRKLSYAVEHSANLIVITDINGRIEYVNPAFTVVTGYTDKEVMGETPRILKSGRTDPQEYQRLWTSILSGKEWRGEFCNRKKNGEFFYVFSTISPIRDLKGRITHFIGIEYDITEQREIERSVYEAETRKAAIVDAALDCVISMGHDGKITEFNPAAEEVFGYKRAHVIGRYVSETIIPVSLREKHHEGLKRYLTTGEGPVLNRRFETTALRCDGSEFPVEISVIRIPLGGLPVFTAYVRDITKRKMAEDQLKKAMAMKDEFVSTVSHELRTPLAISKEGLSLLLRGKVGEFTEQQKEILQMSASNIDRLAFLIDDILDISKIEAGKMRLSRESLDVVKLVQENCRGWELRVKTKNLRLALDAPSQPLILMVDKMRFMQILSNLISNAFKFTPEGGEITVRVEESEGMARFSVADTGAGIPPEDLPRIFEKFYQGRRIAGPGAQGTGLGLSIVQSLVELHGGRLDVATQAGKGSVFSFTIPLVKQEGR